ncbi:PREDICTED: von Willebrand factor-like [Amphimedon queenslandica]|uniref:TIL domain-containing protein n=1 Tax=Amphimedon queenslandica TaxID=400682 RepID=A0A1X7VG97_AMPQE|nr:PREDICTED: von Willebrand factor-like [Amphimedon queenslandica]|eukprot:XP_003384401.1 PREDICTED: von Willebrand factor-like [Amphimedon queenslandica]
MKVLFLLFAVLTLIEISQQQSPTCPTGMQYRTCGSQCPLTCENRDDDVVCPAVCVSGCFCPSGQALVDNDTCIDPEMCPNSTETRNCTGGMVFRLCGSACNLNVTCENVDVPRTCAAVCVSDCFCPTGTALQDDVCTRCPTSSSSAASVSGLLIFSLLLLYLLVLNNN